MSVIGTLLVKMGLDAAGFRTELGGATQSFVDAGQRISQVGMDMAPVSLPILALGQSALTSAMSFETGMNVFQATSGATAAQMERMQTLATELGADMELPGTSAADAAEAMTALAQRGLEVNQVFDASKGVLQLSAAGQLSNARAAELTASALNAFHLAGSEASNVANLLAAGSTASGSSIEQMGQALQASAAVFSAAEIPIEQLITSIGMMASSGIAGSDAGTSLKTMLMALQSPSSTAAAAMQQLGISIYDAHGKMLPFPEIIRQFSTAMGEGATKTVTMGGATGAMAAAAEAAQGKMTGLERALVVAEAHTGMTAQAMRGLIQQWVTAHGTLDGFGATLGGNTFELFRAVQGYDSARNSITAFQNAQGTAHSATVALTEAERNAAMATIFGTDAVRAANIVMMGGVDAFNQMEGASTRQGAAADLAGARMQGLGGAIEGFRSSLETTLMNAVMPMLPALTGIATSAGEFMGQLGTLNPAVIQAGVAIAGVLAVAAPLLMALGPLTIAFGALISPVGLVVVAVAAIAAAFASGTITIDQIRPVLNAVGDAFNWLKGIVEAAMNGIQGIVNGVMQMLRGDISGGMDTIQTSFETAWNTIKGKVNDALQAIIGYVQTNLPQWIAKLGEWATAAWEWLQAAAPIIVQRLGEFVSGLVAELGRKLPGWISAFVAWAERAWKWLQDAVPPLLAKLGEFASSLISELGRKLPGWLTSLGSWALAAWRWLQDAIGPLLAKVGEFALSLIGELGRKLPGWISAFLSFAAAAVSWVATAIPPLLVELAKFLASAVTWIIGTAIPGLVLAALGLAAALIGWVATTLIPGILPALGEFLASVLTFIGNMIAAVVEAAIKVGEGIVNGIREGVQNIWDTFMDWISDLIGGLPEWLKHLLGISSPSRVMAEEIGGPLMMGIVAGMQEAMPTALANIGDLMNQIVGAMSGALNTGGLTGGSGAAIGEMLRWVRAMVEALVAASEWLVNVCEAARDRAKLFVDLAGDLIGIFQDAIGLLTTLADAGSLPVSSGGIVIPVMQFIANMIHTVLAQIALLLPNIVAAGERLTAFNAAAQATITTMQAAVALVSALGEIEVVTNVDGALGVVVDVVLGLVRRLSEQLTPAMMQAVIAARLFADQAGPVVAVIGQTVGIVSQLAAVKIFDVDAAMAAVRQVIIRAVQALRDAAGVISADGLAAARVFADGMGGILGIIGQAVSLLTSAAGAEGWQDLDIDRMFMALRQVIVRSVQVLRDAAGVISAEGLAAARAFADGMGDIMDVVGAAVDVLGAAAGTTDWQNLSIDQIFIALRQVIIRSVQTLRDASGFVAAEGLAAARAFADGMGDIMDVVGAAVDVLGAAAGTTDWEKLDIDRVFTALRQVIVRAVQTLRDASGFVAAEGLAAARAFADNMGDIMDVVGAAVDVLGAAAGATDWEKLDIDRVFVALRQVIVRSVQTLRDASGFVAAEGLAAARAFADGMGDIMDVVGSAVDVLTALAEWQPVDVDGAFVFIRQVIVAAVRVLREASEATGSGLDAAAAFALRSLGMLEAVQRALDVLKALAEFEIPDALAVVVAAWEQMRQIIEVIRGGLMFELAELERYDLLMGAFTMGSSWVQALIEGILSRVPDLVAVLSYISGLFPHSPAKYGPLAQRPDWNNYLMGGLDQAGDALTRRLAGAMPGGRLALAPATASGGRGGQTINVTINNPRGEVSERSLRRELLMLSQLGVLD